MADQLALCNQALARLGTRSSLGSLQEASPEALACRQFFDQAVDATLAAYDWAFATARVSLALFGTAPYPWQQQYARPADCVRARRIDGPGDPSLGCGPWTPWSVAGWTCGGAEFPGCRDGIPPARFEQGVAAGDSGEALPVLLTNAVPATLTYTTNALPPAYWPPLFAAAISWQLAAEMAVSLTGKLSLQQAMEKGWGQVLSAARMQDSTASVHHPSYEPDWLAVRGAGGSGPFWPGTFAAPAAPFTAAPQADPVPPFTTGVRNLAGQFLLDGNLETDVLT